MDTPDGEAAGRDGHADHQGEDASERIQAFQQLRETNPDVELTDAMAIICGINEAEFRVYLTVLDHPHTTTSDIADLLDRDPSTIGKQLKTLSEQGLVERYPRPVDNGGVKYLYEAQPLPETNQWFQGKLENWIDVIQSQLAHLHSN